MSCVLCSISWLINLKKKKKTNNMEVSLLRSMKIGFLNEGIYTKTQTQQSTFTNRFLRLPQDNLINSKGCGYGK